VPCCYERNTNIHCTLSPAAVLYWTRKEAHRLFPNEFIPDEFSGQTLGTAFGDGRLRRDVWEQIFPDKFYWTDCSFVLRMAHPFGWQQKGCAAFWRLKRHGSLDKAVKSRCRGPSPLL
jgi:hypothetical protein